MKLLTGVIAATLIFSLSGTSQASDEDYTKYRQLVMKSLKANLSASAMILKGQVKGNLSAHAAAVANDGVALEHVFPEGSDLGDTDAKATIWEKPQAFKKHIAKFKQVTARFGEEPTMKNLGAVGKGCKSCHKAYREK